MREDEKKGAPAETGNTALTVGTKALTVGNKSLSIGNNTPQAVYGEVMRSKMIIVLNATSSSSIVWTDLDLSAYIGADTDNVYLWMALLINSGSGLAVLGVRPKVQVGVAQAHLVYANANLPMFSLCPVLKTNSYGKIQYQIIITGVINYTAQIWLSGYSTPLTAHNHAITPDPHDHAITPDPHDHAITPDPHDHTITPDPHKHDI